jgi:hypothetical protein
MVAVAGLPSRTADMDLFATLGGEARTAILTGRSFYEIHRRANDGRDTSRAEVEYPPLAVAFVTFPAFLAPPPPRPEVAEEPIYAPYRNALRVLLALSDLATFWILARTQLKHFPASLGVHCLSFLLYSVATGLHFSLLYDRLDVVVGLLLVAALSAMIDGRTRTAGALLALGASFKLVPLLLVPLWVLSDPVFASGLRREPGRKLAAIARRLGWFLLCMLLVNAPFILSEGAAAAGFLAFHRDRGLNVESLFASVLVALRPPGWELWAVYTHGSIEIRGFGTAELAGAAVLVQVGVATWIYRLLLGRVYDGTTRPAQVVSSAAALLVITVVCGKFFSPQYLLWLFPMVFLAPIGARRFAPAAAALGASLLTLAIWPFLYRSEIIGTLLDGAGGATTGPTSLGGGLLLTRNLLLVGMGIACLRPPPGASGSTPPPRVPTIEGKAA